MFVDGQFMRTIFVICIFCIFMVEAGHVWRIARPCVAKCNQRPNKTLSTLNSSQGSVHRPSVLVLSPHSDRNS